MHSEKIVPDYIIYDELKKRRERAGDRPRLEVPRYVPYWPESEEADGAEPDEEPSEGDRGEVTIPMW